MGDKIFVWGKRTLGTDFQFCNFGNGVKITHAKSRDHRKCLWKAKFCGNRVLEKWVPLYKISMGHLTDSVPEADISAFLL